MEAINSVTSSKLAATQNDTLKATEDRFLKLLIAQMRNQDPLNPLENAEVTSQMAQLSTVTGIDKLGNLISGLSNSFSQSQSLQAASMIGRGVFTAGNSLELSNGNAVAAAELPQSVDQMTVTIRDASGAIVHTADLGPQSAGTMTFQWDGAKDNGGFATNGMYTFEVSATSGGKEISNIPLLAFGRVNSVTLGTEGILLNVNGVGSTSLNQVKQIM